MKTCLLFGAAMLAAAPLFAQTAAVAAGPPFGSFDTPADLTLGITGALAITGWALDDTGVTSVEIQRDAHPNDPRGAVVNGRVSIGLASFVTGARPDIASGYAAYPNATRAGWGYLMLTRGLIWDGAGTFRLYAIATDTQGNKTTLGSKTISVLNSSATKPFGNIDSPGQGASVSGVVPVTGWVLTPNLGATIPAAGVQVAIDSVLLPGVPSMSDRADITAGFPSFNASGAGRGLFVDTTQILNGVHSIGWLVTDSTGKADGIGSRFFTISNMTFAAGRHLVGTEMSAGRYFAGPVSSCYWERQSGLSGSLADVIANDFVSAADQIIVDVKATDLAFEPDADCGTWSLAPLFGLRSSISQGTWIVTSQVPAGTYTANAAAGCYWERLSSFDGTLSAIIKNDFESTAGLQTVTISPSDIGFGTTKSCGPWTRVSGSLLPALTTVQTEAARDANRRAYRAWIRRR